MKYSDLCEVYEKVGATTKRLEKIDILSNFLKHLSIADKDVLYLLLGAIYPGYSEKQIGISSQTIIKAISKASGVGSTEIVGEWKKIGDLGEVAEKLMKNKKQSSLFFGILTVKKVITELRTLAEFEGKGTVGKKIDLIAGILSESKSIEAKYVVRTMLSDLRI